MYIAVIGTGSSSARMCVPGRHFAPGVSYASTGSVSEGVVIDIRGLRMRYGSADVLKGVDFVARRGEVLVLLGPNGAGKTTTVEILEGFRMRSAGEVRVLGVDPAEGDERWRARLGVVLQSWRDHGKWWVRELLDNLGRYYAPYGTLERKRPWEVDDLIEAWDSVSRLRSGSPPSQAASAAGWMSPSASSGGRSSCSWTSPPQASTRRRAASSTTSSIA
jgi:hypothetical protein